MTIGVAPTNNAATEWLWGWLHTAAVPDPYPLRDEEPASPWCADRIEIGAIGLSPDTMSALGDFGRCWAWAWIEK